MESKDGTRKKGNLTNLHQPEVSTEIEKTPGSFERRKCDGVDQSIAHANLSAHPEPSRQAVSWGERRAVVHFCPAEFRLIGDRGARQSGYDQKNGVQRDEGPNRDGQPPRFPPRRP